MTIKIVVTVKQVPDTHNVSGNAMNPDGTINRASLPTIFNPEDLNALEEALRIKDEMSAHITVLTMGPAKAVDVLKESLFRGADDVILLSDRRFAGADTLATSYALQMAIQKIGKVDLVFCGRQAIDGDTAQVGPQIAEKLKMNQLTFAGEVISFDQETITVKRLTEDGYQILKAKFPVLVTVLGSANTPRPASVKKIMRYKNLSQQVQEADYSMNYLNSSNDADLDFIKEWNADHIGANNLKIGLSGSPTKVKKIENVVLVAKDVKSIVATKESIKSLVDELVADHILG